MFGSASELKSFFERIGFLYQPFWRLAGNYFKGRGVVPLCGVQAEILNGQYLQGPRFAVLSRFSKYVIASKGYGVYIKNKDDFADMFLPSARNKVLELMRSDVQNQIHGSEEITKEDILNMAEKYRNSCGSWDEAFIRFLSAHDGSKLMAQQAEILRQYTFVCVPFTGRKVFSLCYSFANRRKVLGKAMRQIIRRYDPQGAKYRCTKSLFPLWYPDVCHFGSRALRAFTEKWQTRHFLEAKGNGQSLPTKASWDVGGDIWVRQDDEIEELRSLLNGSMLNLEYINKWLDEIKSYKKAIGNGTDLLRVLEFDLLSSGK